MYQFFVENHQIMDRKVVIEGADVNHIRNVLRMKIKEKIRVSDENGVDYFCEITQIEADQVEAEILSINEAGSELPGKIYLFQGLPKNDKMEWIIQKSVELGVHEIIPVAMKNCVVKLDHKKEAAKIKRWQAISESAAKQSKRSIIPTIREVMSYKEAMDYASECDVVLLPYENQRGMAGTKEALEQAAKAKSVAVFIGPEGGFDQTEIGQAADKTMLISLGQRILRTETAAITSMSLLMYQMELQETE